MKKMKIEQIGLAPTRSMKVGIYPSGHVCPGMGWHVHPEYEVVYIKNGRGTLNICTKQLQYDDGILLFIGPDLPHTAFGNTDLPDQLEVVVQFDETFVTSRLAAFPEFKPLMELTGRSRYGLIFSQAIKAQVAMHFEAMPGQNRAGQLLLFLESLRIMAADPAVRTLFSNPGDLPAQLKPAELKRLDHIFRIINEQYDQVLTSASMAAAIGMTTNSFCRFFKAHTNQPFTVFLNNFRLDRARELLGNSPESIQEVMYACGFRDAPYFSRVFKRYIGITPTEYREETDA
ncbi:helix-turn-helix domain-containing protein [Neolewinella persica]|uniref:helix-turn-helix domain-containing protein n=1 Tax=Neolewinella persica TaxID=70998 RepID=UPI000370B441|nr:AraC family transcriptional regulator [Neolewinella persica]